MGACLNVVLRPAFDIEGLSDGVASVCSAVMGGLWWRSLDTENR